jgi:REP element-mobilizing transposase RayT
MARPPRIDVPGALYHVLARGNQRRTIFRDASDYRRYSQAWGQALIICLLTSPFRLG